MAGHLLVPEGLAWVLPVAGRAKGAVAHRNAVRGFQPAEVPPLHAAGETLALGDAADVNHLADDEMRGGQGRATLQQGLGLDAELAHALLRLNLHPGVVARVGLGHVLDLGAAPAELDGSVAVTLLGAHVHDLQRVQVQHRNGHVGAVLPEHPGHAELLGDQTGSHRRVLKA